MSDIASRKAPTLSRRTLIVSGLGTVLAAAGGGLLWVRRDRFEGQTLSPEAAHDAARTGDVILIDIRRPDEWSATGIPDGAAPLDMRREDFITALDALLDGRRERPVALICARGVRSDRMAARLAEAGFTHILDVPEGMLGSAAGPGWLARDLPVQIP